MTAKCKADQDRCLTGLKRSSGTANRSGPTSISVPSGSYDPANPHLMADKVIQPLEISVRTLHFKSFQAEESALSMCLDCSETENKLGRHITDSCGTSYLTVGMLAFSVGSNAESDTRQRASLISPATYFASAHVTSSCSPREHKFAACITILALGYD